MRSSRRSSMSMRRRRRKSLHIEDDWEGKDWYEVVFYNKKSILINITKWWTLRLQSFTKSMLSSVPKSTKHRHSGSQVVVSVICSWTLMRTLFSWIVFSRQMINTSSGLIVKPSQPLNNSMIICVVADWLWPWGGEYLNRSRRWRVSGITEDIIYSLMAKSALSTVLRLSKSMAVLISSERHIRK